MFFAGSGSVLKKQLDPDPHWEVQLDPDPQKMNVDPQPRGRKYLINKTFICCTPCLSTRWATKWTCTVVQYHVIS